MVAMSFTFAPSNVINERYSSLLFRIHSILIRPSASRYGGLKTNPSSKGHDCSGLGVRHSFALEKFGQNSVVAPLTSSWRSIGVPLRWLLSSLDNVEATG